MAMTLAETIVKGLKFTGYEEDYVFQTIKTTENFYEVALLEKWTPLLGEPRVILDVGANLGNHTLYWSSVVKPEKIFSFEPFTENFAVLSKNIQNNYLSCAQPVQMAIGDKPGELELKSFDPENFGGTTFQYAEPESDARKVSVCTLDAAVQMFQIAHVDFVKIDTEGFELAVIKGMSETLRKDRPSLWIEAGDDTIVEIKHILEALDYCIVDMSGANVLFMQKNLVKGPVLQEEDLLKENLHLLDRVNSYYKNYMTSKKWLAAKDAKLESVNAQLEKYRAQHEQQLKSREEKLSAQLLEDANILAEQEKFLRSVKQQILTLNKQLQQEKQKCRLYEEKLNKVYNTWYGKILLKGYKLLKKVKNFFIKK